jgi:hypothetical protein
MGRQRCVLSSRPCSILPLLLVATACGDDDGAIPDDEFATVSDSIGGDPGGTTPEPDGADETGGADPVPVEDHCLIEPIEGLYGYRYQCEGSVLLDIVIEGGFDGSPVSDSFELPFGHGVEGDSYDDPLVMACCPWYATGSPNCGQHHERACLIDLVEQGCKSMVVKIEDYAYDTFPGVLDTVKRNAVLKIADYVRHHQGDCTGAFWGQTGIAGTEPACDEDDDGVSFASMLETGVWAFDPDGPIDNVEVSVAQAEWTGLYPSDDEQHLVGTCQSADDNDGVVFLEIDPVPESKILRLASGSIALAGPSTEGTGELSPSSTLAVNVEANGSASLENLALHSTGTAVVVTAGMSIPVDAFHVRLWDRTPAAVDADRTTLTIAPGAARFAMSATALGESRVRFATNATPIVLTKHPDGWHTAAFSIAYPHHANPWSLVIAPAQWKD